MYSLDARRLDNVSVQMLIRHLSGKKEGIQHSRPFVNEARRELRGSNGLGYLILPAEGPRRAGRSAGSVLNSPIHCTRKVSTGGPYLFNTITKLRRLYTFVLPRLYGCRGADYRGPTCLEPFAFFLFKILYQISTNMLLLPMEVFTIFTHINLLSN